MPSGCPPVDGRPGTDRRTPPGPGSAELVDQQDAQTLAGQREGAQRIQRLGEVERRLERLSGGRSVAEPESRPHLHEPGLHDRRRAGSACAPRPAAAPPSRAPRGDPSAASHHARMRPARPPCRSGREPARRRRHGGRDPRSRAARCSRSAAHAATGTGAAVPPSSACACWSSRESAPRSPMSNRPPPWAHRRANRTTGSWWAGAISSPLTEAWRTLAGAARVSHAAASTAWAAAVQGESCHPCAAAAAIAASAAATARRLSPATAAATPMRQRHWTSRSPRCWSRASARAASRSPRTAPARRSIGRGPGRSGWHPVRRR